jgi:ParB-like chromosome segregation protein Spo0J
MAVMTTQGVDVEALPVVRLSLEDLTAAGSPRLHGENWEHVQLLAEAYDALPPIIVDRRTMRIIDGCHRVKAARLRGETTIAAHLFEGDETEAFVLAVRLNVTHGLPLTLADRKRAAERIMRCRPQWSNRKVAAVSGISPGTVAVIRKEAADSIAPVGSRVGQDGRVRPVDAGAGRRLAGELLAKDPTLSLRKVARIASISPETVRDVRNRLERGDDLEVVSPPKRSATGRVVPIRPHPDDGGRPPAPVAVHGPTPDPTMVGRWLKADPSLPRTENGQHLLRMFSLHHSLTKDWDEVVTNVPPHCSDVVVDLARQFADLWTGLADRVSADTHAA